MTAKTVKSAAQAAKPAAKENSKAGAQTKAVVRNSAPNGAAISATQLMPKFNIDAPIIDLNQRLLELWNTPSRSSRSRRSVTGSSRRPTPTRPVS